MWTLVLTGEHITSTLFIHRCRRHRHRLSVMTTQNTKRESSKQAVSYAQAQLTVDQTLVIVIMIITIIIIIIIADILSSGTTLMSGKHSRMRSRNQPCRHQQDQRMRPAIHDERFQYRGYRYCTYLAPPGCRVGPKLGRRANITWDSRDSRCYQWHWKEEPKRHRFRTRSQPASPLQTMTNIKKYYAPIFTVPPDTYVIGCKFRYDIAKQDLTVTDRYKSHAEDIWILSLFWASK